MDPNEAYVEAKRQLIRCLGTSYTKYLDCVRKWFNHQVTKDEFNSQMYTILDQKQIHLHNQFLIALLGKCSNMNLTPKLTIKEDPDLIEQESKIKSENEYDEITRTNMSDNLSPKLQSFQNELLSRVNAEGYQPDDEFMFGRVLLSTWHNEVEHIEHGVPQLLIAAVDKFLQNVLSAIISRRSGFQIKSGSVKYSLGHPVVNPWLRNTRNYRYPEFGSSQKSNKRHCSRDLEWHSVFQSAASSSLIDKEPSISIDDVLDTFMANKQIVPAYSIYIANVEKLLAKRSHFD